METSDRSELQLVHVEVKIFSGKSVLFAKLRLDKCQILFNFFECSCKNKTAFYMMILKTFYFYRLTKYRNNSAVIG